MKNRFAGESNHGLNFFIDGIYVEFGDHVYQQTVGSPIGTNCAPLVADLFLYSYEADFVQKSKFKKQTKNHLISPFAM